MRFEETQQTGQQCRLRGARAKLVDADSGQVEKALRPAVIAQRCCQRRKRYREWIIVVRARHRLRHSRKFEGSIVARILIVEDNALNIKLFCDLLAAHGHEPEAVTDSRNALDKAREFGPDLVITDIQLPHVSGLELIRLIRGDPQLAGVPIMAVTAYSAPGDEERIRAAGAEAYVSKPISVVKFAQTVDELLAQDAAEAEAASSPTDANDGL